MNAAQIFVHKNKLVSWAETEYRCTVNSFISDNEQKMVEIKSESSN